MAGEGVEASRHFVRDGVGVRRDGGLQFQIPFARAAVDVIHGGKKAAGMVV